MQGSCSVNSMSDQVSFLRLVATVKESLQLTDANDIKKSFESQIGSKRTFSRIQNCAQLLDVLVDYDIVNENFLEPLKHFVVDPSSLDMIKSYEKICTPNNRCSTCNLNLIDSVPKAELKVSPTGRKEVEQNDEKELKRVMRFVSERLGGNDWVHLARKLDVPESTIKNILNENRGDSVEQAVQMLLKWREERGELATVEELIQALGRGHSRRQDLIDKIRNKKHWEC